MGEFKCFFATNSHEKLAFVYVIMNFVGVAAAYPLMAGFGVAVGAMALLAIEVVLAGYTINRALEFVEDTFANLIREAIKPPLFLIEHLKKYFAEK